MSNLKHIKLDLGVIESWSTGDANILESDLMQALIDAEEQITRSDNPQDQHIEVIIKVAPNGAGS